MCRHYLFIGVQKTWLAWLPKIERCCIPVCRWQFARTQRNFKVLDHFVFKYKRSTVLYNKKDKIKSLQFFFNSLNAMWLAWQKFVTRVTTEKIYNNLTGYCITRTFYFIQNTQNMKLNLSKQHLKRKIISTGFNLLGWFWKESVVSKHGWSKRWVVEEPPVHFRTSQTHREILYSVKATLTRNYYIVLLTLT